jgi:hypothetical protein
MQNGGEAHAYAVFQEETRLRHHQIISEYNVLNIAHQPLDQKSLREYRIARLENQTRFWSRFGVTQSRGSRFELGMEIPAPVSILLKLYLNGVINDEDLSSARSGREAMMG